MISVPLEKRDAQTAKRNSETARGVAGLDLYYGSRTLIFGGVGDVIEVVTGASFYAFVLPAESPNGTLAVSIFWRRGLAVSISYYFSESACQSVIRNVCAAAVSLKRKRRTNSYA